MDVRDVGCEAGAGVGVGEETDIREFVAEDFRSSAAARKVLF